MEKGETMTKTIIFLIWLITFLKNTLFHTYLWQLKEYRFDRMKPHLKLKTSQRMFFSKNFMAVKNP